MNKEINDYLLNAMLNRKVSDRTLEIRSRDINFFSTWLMSKGTVSWDQLSIDLLGAYKEHSLKTVIPSTWNGRFDSIKSFLRYLYSTGTIKIPMHEYQFRILDAISITKDALSEDEYQIFMSYLKTLGTKHGDLRLKLSNSLMAIEGLRVKEVQELKLSLNKDVLKTKILKVVGKGSRKRDIYLSKTTITWLEEYLIARSNHLKEKGIENIDAMILSNYLLPYDPRSMQHNLEEISLKTIPGLNPMRLRKTAITRAVARMPSLKYLPQLAMHFGHTVAVMQKYYLSQDATQVSSIIDRLD